MFNVLSKFKKRVEEFEARRFCQMQSLAPFVSLKDEKGADEVHKEIPKELYFSEEHLDIYDSFVGRDRYLWLYKDVCLPPARSGYDVIGLFDFGKTGEGTNKGFESLLYVDGHPYQGVDTNHPDVIFNELSGKTVRLVFMLWTGLEGGGKPRQLRHLFRRADIGYLHKQTDELYYYARAAVETLELLSQDDPAYSDIVIAMDLMLSIIDWDEDKFYDTVGTALECFKERLKAAKKPTGVTVNCVGHTHIDVAWLWRLKHTREKAMRSFTTVNRLMNEYSDYHFIQSQPQLYEYVKNDSPEIYEFIKNRVSQGLWEPDGGMWLEADCNIPSGESLIRQFIYGIKYIKEEFGRDCSYLWLPDVFGYSWALPQILKGCNIRTFMTTKISWNQYNSIPNDLFIWRGIDGSEVLTYFISTPLDGDDIGNRFATYNGLLTPHSVIGSWKKFKNKDISRETLIAYGYGDGGGGVNRDMLKMAHAMQHIPGLPDVKLSSAGEFFERLHNSVENTDSYLPVWDGELYLEYHRGTYTSQGANKKNNRLYENRLMRSEWLSVLALLRGGNYNSDEIDHCWKILLRNQFHDIIPGSSIREVYEDSDKEYALLGETLDKIETEALNRIIVAENDKYTVINDCSFGGKRVCCLPLCDASVGFRDSHGNILTSQRTENATLVELAIKPFSMETVEVVSATADETEIPFVADINGQRLNTPYYLLEWNNNGQLTRLFDKENNREVLKSLGNTLNVFEDKPVNFDAWDIDLFYKLKDSQTPTLTDCTFMEAGALRCVIRFKYTYRKSTIMQDMILYAHSRRIDFVTNIDWHEDHRLLKAGFSVDIRNTKATFDIQCGHVERPTHYNTSWDYARFEVCAHKWADLSDDSYGVSLMNDCKYGYSIYGNEMQITLLKSSKEPDYAADMGKHSFTYSLLPHAGKVTEGSTIPESHFLNHPVLSAKGTAKDFPALSFEGNIVVDAVKTAENGKDVIIRFHEFRGGRTLVRLKLDGMIGWTLCNMLEQEMSELNKMDFVSLNLSPFEITTVKIHFK